MWHPPALWDKGECYIIGGGASIIKQFGIPQKLAESVILRETSLSEYSPYLSSLHDKHVIGVNAIYDLGTWLDFLFFGDKSFYLKHKNKLVDYPGLIVTCNGSVKANWIKCMPKDNNKKYGITNRKGRLSWNGNSGACAINLAVHLKVKRIYLLGFDMKFDSHGNQHFHGIYGKRKEPKKVEKTFERHNNCFVHIARDAKKRGVEIINLNPNSSIKEFPKMNAKEVL